MLPESIFEVATDVHARLTYPRCLVLPSETSIYPLRTKYRGAVGMLLSRKDPFLGLFGKLRRCRRVARLDIVAIKMHIAKDEVGQADLDNNVVTVCVGHLV